MKKLIIFLHYKKNTRNYPPGDTFLVWGMGGYKIDNRNVIGENQNLMWEIQEGCHISTTEKLLGLPVQ